MRWVYKQREVERIKDQKRIDILNHLGIGYGVSREKGNRKTSGLQWKMEERCKREEEEEGYDAWNGFWSGDSGKN